MGDRRPHPDNVSASSDDSVKAPPRLDPSRIKPGPGALPADAFDPLKHDEWEQFWYTIDQHFQPINQDHVRNLRSIPVNPFAGMRDPDLRVVLPRDNVKSEPRPEPPRRKDKRDSKKLLMSPTKSEDTKRPNAFKVKAENTLHNTKSPSPSNVSHVPPSSPPDSMSLVSSLNSFPLTHRLVAALLDETPTGTPAPNAPPARNNRAPNPMDDCLWMGIGSEPDIRNYQTALEDRVKVELMETGLLDVRDDEDVQAAMRHEQWKLRDTKTMNRIRKGALYTRIVGTELRQQAITREIKRHQDQVEMAYLERMVKNMKKNKKSRSKFQKLMQRMFGHYKEKDKNDKIKKAVETVTNGRLITSGDEKARSSVKKKKKKSDAKGPPNVTAANGSMSRGGAH